MECPQVDLQPDVLTDEAQPWHILPHQRLLWVCNVPLKYGFVIENDNIPYTIENDIFLIYSKIIMSRDSGSWSEIMTSKINSLYINQVWIMVVAPMGMTQQDAIRDVILNFLLLPHTI